MWMRKRISYKEHDPVENSNNRQQGYAWQKENVKKIDGVYHLVDEGILSRKDYSVLFQNDTGKHILPAETTDTLNVYSNVNFTSSFFSFIGRKHIVLNIFNTHGELIGSFIPCDDHNSGTTMLKQARIYLDPVLRNEFARTMECSSLNEIIENIRYYQYHYHIKELKEIADRVKGLIKKLDNTEDISEMMSIEAKARQLYYSGFNYMILDDSFSFSSRSKRPPKDPINAMISFGNIWLYNRIATEIYKTTLDIRIGFVHSTNRRNQTLNLDIADIYKPAIVDRAILSLINTHRIDAKEHFCTVRKDGVYLNNEGKRIFLGELENKLYKRRNIKGNSMTYDFAIKKEIQGILHAVLHERNYQSVLH